MKPSRIGGARLAAVSALMGACSLMLVAVPVAVGSGPSEGPILRADPRLDARTVIAPSRIPNAGNGLYARVRIAQGEVIGELGGQLLPQLNGSWYVAGLPDCAFAQVPPYKYIDSKDHGGHVSRINFAPREINGRETGFQNSMIQRICEKPYVIFVALKDIEPGTEIWASYGPDYNYQKFMDEPAVRDFFCGLLSMDCSKVYEYVH